MSFDTSKNIPEVNEETHIYTELIRFRHSWADPNAAFGDARWRPVLEYAKQIDKSIDEVRTHLGSSIAEVFAAKDEITLAIMHAKSMPKKVKDELDMYCDLYKITLGEPPEEME